MNDKSGIIVIDKPVGLTSFDVVSRIRRIFEQKKVGHCGTLDPFATGVLPVCIGRATSAVRFMDGYDKEYIAVLRLGISTLTEDNEGEAVQVKSINSGDIPNIIASLPSAVDSLKLICEQVPPMFSAIKKDGVPLYRLARKGVEIEREPRNVKIYNAEYLGAVANQINVLESYTLSESVVSDISELESVNVIDVSFKVKVSKGTYIRTLGTALAQALGVPGHLCMLQRTSCGTFNIEKAVTLDRLLEEKNRGIDIKKYLVPTDEALIDMPPITLGGGHPLALLNGKKIPLKYISVGTFSVSSEKTSEFYRIYDSNKTFLGVAKIEGVGEEKYLKAERMFLSGADYKI